MDWFNDLGAVEWFRDQFVDPSAWSVFRLMLLSWALSGAVFIGLDRVSTALLGRSRPLAQQPPIRARAWRWGRRTPPQNYSLMPAGTTVESTVPLVAAPVPLKRPMIELGPGPDGSTYIQLPDPSLPMTDTEFWRLFAEGVAPIFGFENGIRLDKGQAPERYNPITGRVEALERDTSAGTILWAWQADDPHVVGPD